MGSEWIYSWSLACSRVVACVWFCVTLWTLTFRRYAGVSFSFCQMNSVGEYMALTKAIIHRSRLRPCIGMKAMAAPKMGKKRVSGHLK